MKKTLSITMLSMTLLLGACKTSDNEDKNLNTNPREFLEDLPAIYTSNLPINLEEFNIGAFNAEGTATLYLSYDKGTVLPNPDSIESAIGAIPAVLAPLFNRNNNSYANVVGYKGTMANFRGDTSDPLHSKVFTLLAGDQTVHFGYFEVNGTKKFYSFDPANNRLGNLEASIQVTGTRPPSGVFVYDLGMMVNKITVFVYPRQ